MQMMQTNPNPFMHLTPEDVEFALGKGRIKLTDDQKDLMMRVQKSASRTVAIEANPGNGKTLVVTGMMLALLPTLEKHERVIWLTKTRAQRDAQVNFCRRYLKHDPFAVIGLGRPSEGDGTGENFFPQWWDTGVKAKMYDEVASFQEAFRVGKQWRTWSEPV